MAAARRGNREVVKILIKYAAQVDMTMTVSYVVLIGQLSKNIAVEPLYSNTVGQIKVSLLEGWTSFGRKGGG